MHIDAPPINKQIVHEVMQSYYVAFQLLFIDAFYQMFTLQTASKLSFSALVYARTPPQWR